MGAVHVISPQSVIAALVLSLAVLLVLDAVAGEQIAQWATIPVGACLTVYAVALVWESWHDARHGDRSGPIRT